jgi:hypothetical protein
MSAREADRSLFVRFWLACPLQPDGSEQERSILRTKTRVVAGTVNPNYYLQRWTLTKVPIE